MLSPVHVPPASPVIAGFYLPVYIMHDITARAQAQYPRIFSANANIYALAYATAEFSLNSALLERRFCLGELINGPIPSRSVSLGFLVFFPPSVIWGEAL